MTRRFDWTPFARGRRDVITLLIVAPMATMLVPLALSQLLPWRFVAPVVFAVAGTLYLRAGARYNALACPRCGGRFFEPAMRSEPAAAFVGFELLSSRATCRHCGLQLGEQREASVDGGTA